ncbi:MAG TPA: alpha/beta fold hydrolase [Anaerolineae bacterium]|nr:alpha/beta fold hydrolase [Anaerolineae bacterium]HQH36995.1 alpha/beta fold hydrolase [Anaerolineae bacterium]
MAKRKWEMGKDQPPKSTRLPLADVQLTDFQSLYPFASHWLDVGGVKMHYLDEGPRDAPPVVMVHGNPTWSFYYRTLIPEISQTHRVIVPDHVGCGLSDKPQVYPYTLEQHIRNLETLIAHLELHNVTLVLHDWGGGIGMGYATRHPENSARFVIFNTSAFYAPAVPWVLKLARSPLIGETLLRGLNAFAGLAVYLAMVNHKRMTAQVRAGYLAPYNTWQNRIAIYRFVRDIPLSDDHPTRATIGAIDAQLHLFRDHPMLILWGAQDFVFTVKDFLVGWQARFPHADVHILDHAGHYVVEDAYERILPLMKGFLSRP